MNYAIITQGVSSTSCKNSKLMKKIKEIMVETVIVGGGFSGLFLADSFIKSGYNSFLLMERHKNTMGGYAVLGGIKVSLLPAGESTKKDTSIRFL